MVRPGSDFSNSALAPLTPPVCCHCLPPRLPTPCRAAAGASAAGSFPEGPAGWGLPGSGAAAGDRQSVHHRAGGHTAASSSNSAGSSTSSSPLGGAGAGAGGSGSSSAAPGLGGLGVRPAERSAAQRYKDELHTLNVGGWGLGGRAGRPRGRGVRQKRWVAGGRLVATDGRHMLRSGVHGEGLVGSGPRLMQRFDLLTGARGAADVLEPGLHRGAN